MAKAKQSSLAVSLAFTRKELVVINNALNEICNGLPLDDDEFQTRIGYPRATAESLLKKVARALDRKV